VTFGALRLALEAGRAGGTAPAVLNAANEIAVGAFLSGRCSFLDIERIVETLLERHSIEPVDSLEQLEDIDARTRHQAQQRVSIPYRLALGGCARAQIPHLRRGGAKRRCGSITGEPTTRVQPVTACVGGLRGGYSGAMDTFIEGFKVVFFGILMFSLIVVVHEAGHFTAARLFGLRVKEFMIGLPGPNIGFTFKGTKFGVTPILLGGYALIAGEGGNRENNHLASAFSYLAERGTLTEDEARDAEGTLGYDLEEALDVLDAWGTIKRVKKKGRYSYLMPAAEGVALGAARPVLDAAAHIAAERKLTFNAAPWYQRIIILAAGVIFNLLFAIIVFTAIQMSVGSQIATMTIESVVEDTPAARIALEPGDTILAFDGSPVESWAAFTELLGNQNPGDEVTLTVERDGTARDFTTTLADNDGRALLGVISLVERVPIPFVEALSTSFGFIGMVATAIVQLFNPATFGDIVSQSTSVVGISFEAKNAAESGFLPFAFLCAALSISIGLMNLLPFPPLDGGRIVVETIERVTRRSIPVRVINSITLVALALLLMLFFFVTGQDIQNYILGG
jgi:regulator of sigma E protease